MIIRQEQMGAFSKELKEQFVQRMVRHLKEDFAKDLERRNILPTEVEAMVRRGISEAEQYRVTNEQDLELYVECLAFLDQHFDSRVEWAAAILRRPGQDGTAKMNEINDHLLFGLSQPK
jgi:hypothetical protein